jgi:twitching motility protein PilI
MAKQKLNLQAYQQGILERLRSLSESGHASFASKLGVRMGGANWLVALDDVSEVLPVPEIMPVPLTQSWFMGMANVRGNLYALTDLGAFLGKPAAAVTGESRILLVHSRFELNAGLLVDRLIGLRNLEDMHIQQETEAAPAWQLASYRDANDQVWNELDTGMLLGRNEFMQVAA